MTSIWKEPDDRLESEEKEAEEELEALKTIDNPLATPAQRGLALYKLGLTTEKELYEKW